MERVQLPSHAQPGIDFQVAAGDSREVRMLRVAALGAANWTGDATLQSKGAQLLKHDVAVRSAAAVRAAQVPGAAALSGLGATQLQRQQQGVLHGDVRGSVYVLAASSGDTAAYQLLQKEYKACAKAGDANERLRLSKALAAGATTAARGSALERALAPGTPAAAGKELLRAFGDAGGAARLEAWQWVLANTGALAAKFPSECHLAAE